MDENAANESTLYLYHTIVNDNNSLLSDIGNCTYAIINNVTEEEEEDEKEQVMYLSLKSEDAYSSDIVLNSINDYEPEDSNLPKLEYTFDPSLISVEPLPDSNLDANEDNDNTNEIILRSVYTEEEDDSDTDYTRVHLEDGTCAYINNALWNSLIQNTKQNDITKTNLVKKEKKFRCNYYGCGKIYSSAHHLTVHLRNHTGNRPYQCPAANCDKAFSTSYSLKAHLRTHTGEAPYGCNVCPKHFKTSGDLQKHLRTHTGEKPFKCTVSGCGKSFTTSNIRKVHIRSHTGERPYACKFPDCKKAFASATNFKNHMRIHSGEKPYKCPVPGCGKCFTEYSSLFKHNSVHRPFVPIRCEYCDHTCKHETTMRAHKQAVHKVIVTENGTELRVQTSDRNYIYYSNE